MGADRAVAGTPSTNEALIAELHEWDEGVRRWAVGGHAPTYPAGGSVYGRARDALAEALARAVSAEASLADALSDEAIERAVQASMRAYAEAPDHLLIRDLRYAMTRAAVTAALAPALPGPLTDEGDPT